MSENIKYFYLKLKDNFFDNEEMKLLESQKNGTEYQNLYLKLCLLAVKNKGKLIYKDLLPYDLNMLSTILRMNIDTVKTGIELLNKLRLIDILDNGTMYMTDIQSLIGHSSTEAERKKEYRKRIKQDKTRTKQGQCLPELELDIKLELNLDIDNIKITRRQYDILLEKYTKENVIKILNKLSSYKLAHGKNYKSDYGAINQWVVDALKLNIKGKINPNLEVII